MTDASRKPRIALMGEFSSGKSTLSNLLIGARALPEKVTATRLSPVWMAYGTDTPYRIDVSGDEAPIELNAIEDIDVDTTRAIRLFFEADILEVCDLIDFPGISDPNMSSEVWQRMLDEVDAILWCTHATQAWRQSEAAVWDTIPEAVRERSILLVTRFDKLTTENDRYRVLARLNKSTKDLFGATFPISLTEALAAGEDDDAFVNSGAGAFLDQLITLIEELTETVSQMDVSIYKAAMLAGSEQDSTTVPSATMASTDAETPAIDESAKAVEPAADDDAPRIMPKRVQSTRSSTGRPSRPTEANQIRLVYGADSDAVTDKAVSS